MNIEELNIYFESEKKRFGLLQNIANKYGDFRVAESKMINNEPFFSKWSSVLEVSGGKKYNICHRQILPYEIVLDMDDPSKIDVIYHVYDALDEIGIKNLYLFATGSKGLHLHIFLLHDYYTHFLEGKETKEWNKLMESFRQLCRNFDFDEQKIYRNVPIAMEFAPHWKSGKQKKLVRKKGDYYERFAQID